MSSGWSQVKTLVTKDIAVMRRHYLWLGAEIFIPIIVSVLASYCVVDLINKFNVLDGLISDMTIASNPMVETGTCNGWNGATPPNFQDWVYDTFSALNRKPFGWCYFYSYSTVDGMLQSYATQNPAGVWGMALSADADWTARGRGNTAASNSDITVYTAPDNALGGTLPGYTDLVMRLLMPDFYTKVERTVGYYGNQRFNRNVLQMIATGGAFILVLGYFPLAASMAGRLVDDKRNRVREHLKVLGVRPIAYVLSVLATATVRVTLCSTVILLVLMGWGAKAVHPAYVAVVFVTLLIFGYSLCAFSTVLPAFISKSQIAIGVVAVFMVVGAIGSTFATELPGPAVIAVAALFSPAAAMYSVAPLMANMHTTLPVSPGLAVVFLLAQTLVYALLGEYLYAINPGDYGVPLPPTFPFLWLWERLPCSSVTEKRHDHEGLDYLAAEDSSNAASSPREDPSPTAKSHHSPAEHRPAGAAAQAREDRIVVENLVKYYGSQRDVAAVNGLDLRIHKGEIFALLGHNGAGKTTTFSILIGMVTASTYKRCQVAGCDVRTETHQLRRAISCCPQYDILFDDLSGMQHLELYAAIKGVPPTRAEELLTRLRLPLGSEAVSTYSGGMKRRLSVGCALVGGSPVVFLDEPSSGLDPVSRRHLWSLLKEERASHGTTIVLTTHFMEEADHLGDRIAIMSHGRVVCCGTSESLKQTHGVGYYLTVSAIAGAQVDARGVQELCNEYCEGAATKYHETTTDVTFLLPVQHVDRYGDMLEKLEANQEALRVASYGMAVNSLDDVFVRVTQDNADGDSIFAASATGPSSPSADDANNYVNMGGAGAKTAIGDDEEAAETAFAQSCHASSCGLFFSHVATVFRKKALVFRRSPRLLFMSGVMPLIFVAVAFAAAIPNFKENSDDDGRAEPNLHDPMPVIIAPAPLIYYDPAYSTSIPPLFLPVLDTECANRVLQEFQAVVDEYSAHVDSSLPKLTFMQITDSALVKSAGFIDQKSIAWTSSLKAPPPILSINGCPNSNFIDVLFGEPWIFNYTWMYQGQGAEQNALYRYDMLLATALARLAGTASGPHYVPRLHFGSLPAATGTGWWDPPTTPPPGNKPASYFDDALSAVTIIGVSQYAASSALLVAEELSKGTVDLMRIHGLLASSYWVGTFLFDFLAALPIAGLFVAGAWARNIAAMQTNCMWSLSLVGMLGLITFSLLLGYALVSLLPRSMKQGAYVAAVFGVCLLLFGTPLFIMAMYYAANPKVDENSFKWTWFMTPQRAFAIVISMQADLPFEVCVWTRNTTPLKGLASIFAWCILPIVVLIFTTHRDVFTRWRKVGWKDSFAAMRRPDGGGEGVGDGRRTSTASRQAMHTESAPLMVPSPRPGPTENTKIDAAGVDAAAVAVTDEDTWEDVLADPDVRAEHRRVQEQLIALMNGVPPPRELKTPTSHDDRSPLAAAAGQPDMVLMAELEKLYVTRTLRDRVMCRAGTRKRAVKGISFGLRAGECFGLLGPNGAGKTTSVKMMLREHPFTAGDVSVAYAPPLTDGCCCGCCLPPSRDAIYRASRFGVCPQFDALWDQLTAIEHMELFLRLRLGFAYKRSDWAAFIERSLAKVQLADANLKKPSERYSGGMKRKLSVCIAMYTGAAAVFLDEPSTGMDPHARRALWKSIHEALRGRRCVLLTTHSMEEADAVCGRIAIVTGGVMRCVGSSHHLKARFGSGYTATVTLRHPSSFDGGDHAAAEALASAVRAKTSQLLGVGADAVDYGTNADSLAAGKSNPRIASSQPQVTSSSGRMRLSSSFGAAPGATVNKDADELEIERYFDAAGKRLDREMAAAFGPTCQLAEALGATRQYTIADLHSVAAAFKTMAAHKEAWAVESYNVTQLTSLEQVFIQFAGGNVHAE